MRLSSEALAQALTERLASAAPPGMQVVVMPASVVDVERIAEMLNDLADEASELIVPRGAERPPELAPISLDAISCR